MVSRSSNDGKAWRCRCGTVNLPTQHRIFKLPAFHCSNCGRKLALDFKFCLGDIEIGGKSLLGEVRDQGKDPYCVAFAYAKAAEVMERGMSISNGTDPDLVIPINPCRLEKRFVEKYPDVSLDGALTRSLGVHKVLHMGLILRSEGIQRFDVGSTTKPEEQINNDEPYKVADVSTISCDSFEEICKTLAEGTPLVATYLAGKRRSRLPYCKIYKSPSKAAIKAKGAKEIGHAVVLVGAGMKRGKKYFYILNSWGKKFCPRKNKKGEIVSGGIGKLRAEDLTKNLIKLCPQAGGERRLHDQQEFKISRINYLLMTGKEKHCSTQRLKRLREEATSKYVPAVIFDDGIFRDDEGGSQVCPSISENSYITSSDCVKAYSDPNNTARSAEAGQGHPRVQLPHEVLQAPSQLVRDMDRHPFLPGGNPRFDGNRGGDFCNNWQGQGNRNWVPHGHDERDPRNQPWQNVQGPQDDQREGSGTNQKVESTKVEASVNNSTQTAVKNTQSNVDGGVGTQNIQQELTDRPQFCQRCGRVGHNPNACPNPVVCIRCKNEGHVARICQNNMPWEFIAPFYGLSAYGQGFHVIHSAKTEECVKDMSSIAGEVTARQIEHEFTVKAGKSSNWRWYAKRVGEGKYEMRFPNAQTLEDVSFFPGLRMRSVPEAVIKIEKWNPATGSKGALDVAWFRIPNIPVEKRYYSNVCMVASKVGLPLKVDKDSLNKNDYVRVGLSLVRNGRDNARDEAPSPKKQKTNQASNAGQPSHAGPSNTSNTGKGKQVTGGSHQVVDQQQSSSDFGSEYDEWIAGDPVAPGTETDQPKFRDFGVHLRKVSCIAVDVNPEAVINEYGSNFVKYKQDLLVAIEAKNALNENSKDRFFKLEDYIMKPGASKCLPKIAEEKEEELATEGAVSASPIKGSQGAPEAVLSSQEEPQQFGNHKADWEANQESTEDADVIITKVSETGSNKNIVQASKEGMEMVTDATKSVGDEFEKVQPVDERTLEPEVNVWNIQEGAEHGMINGQKEDNKEIDVEWQNVRQSKIIEAGGKAQMKMGDQTQKKTNKETDVEGLMNDDMKTQVVQGADGVKSVALHFHKQDLKRMPRGTSWCRSQAEDERFFSDIFVLSLK